MNVEANATGDTEDDVGKVGGLPYFSVVCVCVCVCVCVYVCVCGGGGSLVENMLISYDA